MAPGPSEVADAGCPRRVVIVGNAGGGKSTLARKLAGILDIPYRSLDDIQWAPGWTRLPDESIAAAQAAWLADEAWIIDGYGPRGPMIDRLKKAELILHVRHPFWRHVWWVTKRQLRAHLGPPPASPPGCDFRGVYWSMLSMMWHLHRERDQLTELITKEAPADCRISTLGSAAEINAFLASIQEKCP